jgi:hypothetical protein
MNVNRLLATRILFRFGQITTLDEARGIVVDELMNTTKPLDYRGYTPEAGYIEYPAHLHRQHKMRPWTLQDKLLMIANFDMSNEELADLMDRFPYDVARRRESLGNTTLKRLRQYVDNSLVKE